MIQKLKLPFGILRSCVALQPLFSVKFNFTENKHKYKAKTTKQIEREIGNQKWKQLQNTFKSLSSNFGLDPPTEQQFSKQKYPKPDREEYNLQNLRRCSKEYPVYLYWQLKNKNSPFNQVVTKVIDNLWKAEQKETLQFLEFLYAWKYQFEDVSALYERIIGNYDLTMLELFSIVKKFEGKLWKVTEMKVLERLEKGDLLSSEYSGLLRIFNFFTVKNLLNDQFIVAVTRLITQNINKIPPVEALQAYIYFTFNLNQLKQQTVSQNFTEENISDAIIKIIEKRILSPECIKFYNGQQIVSLLHTFIKNNLIINQNNSEYYQEGINKIIDRIELVYISQDFTAKDKEKLLEISGLLPQGQKKIVIALIQRQLLKKKQKFEANLLPSLYLISEQNNMMTDEIRQKIVKFTIQNIFQLDKKQISRVCWLFTIGNVQNLRLLHEKVEEIILGGFRDFTIKDICIIVWSMCANNYKQNGQFWTNIEDFIFEEISRRNNKKQKEIKKSVKNQSVLDIVQNQTQSQKRKLVNQCAWTLWAYQNNRQLKLKTVDLIIQVLMNQFSTQNDTTHSKQLFHQVEHNLVPFQLISFVSFFYSIDFPSQTLIKKVHQILFQQFTLIFDSMSPIQLCTCLKYFNKMVWSRKDLAERILQLFQNQSQKLHYRDIMPVVAILMNSNIRTQRVVVLIKKLIERKKNLQALKQKQNAEQKQKDNKWQFRLPF